MKSFSVIFSIFVRRNASGQSLEIELLFFQWSLFWKNLPAKCALKHFPQKIVIYFILERSSCKVCPKTLEESFQITMWCIFTGRYFQNKINYHFNLKNSWNLSCKVCPKTFPPNRTLTIHIGRNHEVLKLKCDVF